MTKTQKTILIILIAFAVLIGVGLIALSRNLDRTEPAEDKQSPIPIPVVELTIGPFSSAVPTTTAHPTADAAAFQPEVTPYETASPSNATATPERAYVYWPTAAPAATTVPTVPTGMAFTLSILGKTIHVADNVEADTLEQTPGWLPTSAKPGKEGTCVVYGHRNRNHLLILKDIEIGDEIDVILPDGTVYTYIVEKAEILDSEESLHIPLSDGKHLILITCYPFHYSGHAPLKFLVTCSIKAGDRV